MTDNPVAGPRRSGSEYTLNYASIGATQDPVVFQHPPKNFKARSLEVRMGRRPKTFEVVHRWLLDWGLQKAIRDTVVLSGASPGVQYLGVAFDRAGLPSQPATTLGPQRQTQPLIDSPTKAKLKSVKKVPQQSFKIFTGAAVSLIVRAPLRMLSGRRIVVNVIDEENRKGFVIGTCIDSSWLCEEFIFTEYREDDSVWVTIINLTENGAGRAVLWNFIKRNLRTFMYWVALRRFAAKNQ